MHMPNDIDNEEIQKLTNWLFKLNQQFNIYIFGLYSENLTFLLIEAFRST